MLGLRPRGQLIPAAEARVVRPDQNYAQGDLDFHGLKPILTIDMPTVVEGDFEWDSTKAESNFAKHGVSFAEAATVS